MDHPHAVKKMKQAMQDDIEKRQTPEETQLCTAGIPTFCPNKELGSF